MEGARSLLPPSGRINSLLNRLLPFAQGRRWRLISSVAGQEQSPSLSLSRSFWWFATQCPKPFAGHITIPSFFFFPSSSSLSLSHSHSVIHPPPPGCAARVSHQTASQVSFSSSSSTSFFVSPSILSIVPHLHLPAQFPDHPRSGHCPPNRRRPAGTQGAALFVASLPNRLFHL